MGHILDERIVRAAVLHPDGGVYSVPVPGRHHDVIRVMGARFRDHEKHCVFGFLTNTGRFVDREEGHRIAKDSGQIIFRCGGDSHTLYSENLW